MILHDLVDPSPRQWQITVRNTRNSWESWEKSDSHIVTAHFDGLGSVPVGYHLGPNDLGLLTRLAVAGGDHGKFARSLPIQMELEVTGSFLRQLYTYRAGVGLEGGEPIEPTDLTINATSVMHTAGRRAFVMDDMDVTGIRPDIAEQMLAAMNAQREHWIKTGKKKPGPEWRGLVNTIPGGWKYRIHLSFNYAVARSFVQSREKHRLRDDWGVLCEALKAMPYSAIITTGRSA